MTRIEQIKNRLANASDGPWSQGRLLLTNQTKRWPEDVRKQADDSEKLRVFSWFSSLDEGRCRQFICETREIGDAEFIANAKYDIQFLLSQLEVSNLTIERLSNRVKQLEKDIADDYWPYA